MTPPKEPDSLEDRIEQVARETGWLRGIVPGAVGHAVRRAFADFEQLLADAQAHRRRVAALHKPATEA